MMHIQAIGVHIHFVFPGLISKELYENEVHHLPVGLMICTN